MWPYNKLATHSGSHSAQLGLASADSCQPNCRRSPLLEVDGWMNGWAGEWMNGWIYERMDFVNEQDAQGSKSLQGASL